VHEPDGVLTNAPRRNSSDVVPQVLVEVGRATALGVHSDDLGDRQVVDRLQPRRVIEDGAASSKQLIGLPELPIADRRQRGERSDKGMQVVT
jgi:hypothetical protein